MKMMKPARVDAAIRSTPMIPLLLLVSVLASGMQSGKPSQNPPEKKNEPTHTTLTDRAEGSDGSSLDEQLSKVKRIYVDSFGEDAIARQVQAMVVAELTRTKLFIVTENKDKADAILRGAGLEKTSQEVHSYSDSTAIGGAAGGHSGSVSGHSINGVGSISGNSSGGFVSRSAAISDSSLNTETVNDARVAVRLVDKDGDIIWATSQESQGAKYKGATGDVAEKVVKQLVRDFEKAKKGSAHPPEVNPKQ
jgi:curli biogenesis system outer membrane secretion channel CsgG